MTTEQALAIASLLIDFEIEQPQVQPPPPGWITDLRKARLTIQKLITQEGEDRRCWPGEPIQTKPISLMP